MHIHPCANCGGLWFDHGKLQDLRAAQPDNLEQLDEAAHGVVEPSAQIRDLVCPACKGALSPYRYALDAKIELDVCHDCRGIWVPQDEVKLLAAAMKANRPRPPQPQDTPPTPPSGPPPITYHRTALDGVQSQSAPRAVVPPYAYGPDYGLGYGPGYGYGYDTMDGLYFRQAVAADIATVAAVTALDFMLW